MDQDKEDEMTPEPEKPGTGKARSETPYPYFGLLKVMEIVRAVQGVGGNSEAPATDVLAQLKIGKTDRLWAYGVPSSILFGVVERVGRGEDARLKLTELGRRLALPGTVDEERASKAAALKTPELYLKLLEQFSGNPLPEKEVLKRLLQRDYKIVESMAGNAAEAFLESVKAAELITIDGKICSSHAINGDDKSNQIKPEIPAQNSSESDTETQVVRVPSDFIVYKCKISKSRVIEIPLPSDFTQTDVKRLHAFLLTQVDDDATE